MSLPIGKGRKAIFVDNYYAAQSVDRETGIDNSRAMRRVFEVASNRGPVPGLICMDANLPIRSDGALRGLMEEYGWEDAGEMQCKIEGKGEEPGATFSQSGDFEKEKGISRIDTILLNSQARTMFHRFWMTEEGKLVAAQTAARATEVQQVRRAHQGLHAAGAVPGGDHEQHEQGGGGCARGEHRKEVQG